MSPFVTNRLWFDHPENGLSMVRDKLSENTIVAFDTETSGKYPMTAEICEIAAVKWRAGQVVDTFQSFVAVKKPMSAEVIAIHNITNEMLVGAPSLESVIRKFLDFIDDCVLVAHHAPFDLGFLAYAMEQLQIPLPKGEAFCTSLMSRNLFLESENHKLQTLIKFFNIEQGQAHRALDDSKACLQVALKCFEKIGWDRSFDDVNRVQGWPILWSDFSIRALMSDPRYRDLVIASKDGREVQIVYSGGSRPGEARTVVPLGLVRNPQDDFLIAQDNPNEMPKRYFLKRISASRL